MYTNIDTEEILQAFNVCKNNYFTKTTYGCFKQIFGIAIGSQLSKKAANLIAY